LLQTHFVHRPKIQSIAEYRTAHLLLRFKDDSSQTNPQRGNLAHRRSTTKMARRSGPPKRHTNPAIYLLKMILLRILSIISH